MCVELVLVSVFVEYFGWLCVNLCGCMLFGVFVVLIVCVWLLLCNDMGVLYVVVVFGMLSIVIVCGSDMVCWVLFDVECYCVFVNYLVCCLCMFELCLYGYECVMVIGVGEVIDWVGELFVEERCYVM